jgi:hypothetical protein
MGDIDPYPSVQIASCTCEHCRAQREETLKHKVTSLEAENRSLSADNHRRIEEMAGLRNALNDPGRLSVEYSEWREDRNQLDCYLRSVELYPKPGTRIVPYLIEVIKHMRSTRETTMSEELERLGEIRNMRSHISDALSYMQQGQEALREVYK